MTDRLFTACCYGSDHQHAANEPCPQDAQGGEARQGGDGEAGSVHEHPVGNADAPDPTPDQFTSPSQAMFTAPVGEEAGATGRAG